MNINPDDPIVTEYALGELEESSQSAVERALTQSPEGRKSAEEILQTAQLLKGEFESEHCERLSIDQRSSVNNAIKAQEGAAVSSETVGEIMVLQWRKVLAFGAAVAMCLLVLFALVESPKSPPPTENDVSDGDPHGEESQEPKSLVAASTPAAASEKIDQSGGFYEMDPALQARYGLLPPFSRRDGGERDPRVKVTQSPDVEPSDEDGLKSPDNRETVLLGEQVPPPRRFSPYSRLGVAINSTNNESMASDRMSRYGLGPARSNRQPLDWIRSGRVRSEQSAATNSRLTVAVPLTRRTVVFRKKNGGGLDGSYDRFLFVDGQGRDGELAKADKLVFNIKDTDGKRFGVVRLLLGGNNLQLIQSMNSNRDRLQDAAMGVLLSKTLSEISKPGFRNQLRQELRSRFNKLLGPDLIDHVVITEFVIQ